MKQPPEDPDSILVRAFIDNGDRRSFSALVEKYQHDVFNFCFRFLGNEDDAADCSQEVFIRIYRHLPKFRFRAKFSTWVYRVMVNACNDMARAKGRRDKQVSLDTPPGEREHAPDRIPDGAASGPEQKAIRKEMQEVFQSALGRIREKYRTVIILRDIEGRSYEEISVLTGMKPGTVRSTLARARLQMAGYLKDYRYEM